VAKKVASPELQRRMTTAIAMIGRGVNQSKPDMEDEGRRLLSLARVESEILLGRQFFTKEDLSSLANMLFDLDDEDYTADAVETNAEALARTRTAQPDKDGDIEDLEPDEL